MNVRSTLLKSVSCRKVSSDNSFSPLGGSPSLDGRHIRDRPTSPRSPWQNGYVERLIDSIRTDLIYDKHNGRAAIASHVRRDVAKSQTVEYGS
jgi:hypothetical protein